MAATSDSVGCSLCPGSGWVLAGVSFMVGCVCRLCAGCVLSVLTEGGRPHKSPCPDVICPDLSMSSGDPLTRARRTGRLATFISAVRWGRTARIPVFKKGVVINPFLPALLGADLAEDIGLVRPPSPSGPVPAKLCTYVSLVLVRDCVSMPCSCTAVRDCVSMPCSCTAVRDCVSLVSELQVTSASV